MAKFSKGDRITDGNAVYEITDVDDGIYEWKFVSGKADPSHSGGGEIAWAEGKMRLANSRACNAEPKPGDKVYWRNGQWKFEGTFVKKLPGGYNRVKTDRGEINVLGDVYLEGQNPTFTDTPFGRVYNGARSANAVVQNAINACGTARNGDINQDLGRDVDRLAQYITEDLKKQAESYAYWIEADCGRQVNYLLRVAEGNNDVQPSIVAELKRLRRRVDDAIAASKRLPR